MLLHMHAYVMHAHIGLPWSSRFASTKKFCGMEMKGIGMVNQQKEVQQETAYSAVVVNDHMYPRPYIVFDPKGVIKIYIIHYNCTIGSFLLHFFLLIYQ